MKCLIVAAGQGVRLQEKLELKPLVPIRGVPLIEHVMCRARQAGIEEFVVVSGYRGAELRLALDTISTRQGLSTTHLINGDWNRANGLSVYQGKPILTEPFLLMMCDHLVDSNIIVDLASSPHRADSVVLAVDYNIANPLVDMNDVTRVSCFDGRIQSIGKQLLDFNCFDTGIFMCAPIIFDALEESQAHGDDSISGAMNVLARWRKAYGFDIGNRAWIDVDDMAAFGIAENLLESGRL